MEFAVRVKVQLLVLAPLLEHAPLSVIVELGGNWATALVPVGTLKPAGLETTRSPLRPPAVTSSESVVGAATGFTVNVAERVTPPPPTEIVT